MIIFGNIVLAVAILIYIAVARLVFFTRIPGGDAVVGFAWAVIFSVLAFSICLSILTAIIGSIGGFSWVGSSSGSRSFLVFAGLILILIGNGFFMFGEFPGGLPPLFRSLIKSIPAILPGILLVGAAVLLNFKVENVSALLYKLPIYTGFAFGIFALGLIMHDSSQRSIARLNAEKERRDTQHQRHLEKIETTDVSKDMVFLLVLTDSNHATDVREAALAKIKSRADWQEELVRRLQNDWAPEAFNFLASNEVEDKSMFEAPLREGVLIQARLIREAIRKCTDHYALYEGRFTWEVDRVIRSVNRFKGGSVDYKPAMEDLRRALDEPTSFKKPRLPAKDMLDQWLKEN